MASPPFKLDRLSRFKIVEKDGNPTQSFQRLWQKLCEKIEAQEAQQDQQIADILAARKEDARTASYTATSDFLTGTDAGSDASVLIDDHTRIYPGDAVSDLNLHGIAAVTGLAFSTQYFLYYDDTTLTNATPVVHATTVEATAQVGAANGRHFLGKVTTPANGAPDVPGGGTTPPGNDSPLP
ncbi:MAG: hypothetical protein V4527_18410 [Pseudomonadota bacterium]